MKVGFDFEGDVKRKGVGKYKLWQQRVLLAPSQWVAILAYNFFNKITVKIIIFLNDSQHL